MPGYLTRQDAIAIHGAADLLIHSLLDRQQFADPLGEAEALGISSAAWPLFGLLWPSALHLAAHMASRALVPHERILEVGCGLALASLVAHRRGSDVTASDCHPLTEAFLAENTRLNGLKRLPYRHGQWGAAIVVPAQSLTHREPDAARPARQIVQGRFGLIIASDVLYERDDAGLLCAFINRHALPVAEVLIIDPNRGNRPPFHKRMAAAGFTLQETRLHGQPDSSAPAMPGPEYRGRLLRFSRAAGASGDGR